MALNSAEIGQIRGLVRRNVALEEREALTTSGVDGRRGGQAG
jgi:hypothetical protein